MRLKDKVAIVTGSSKGIGEGIARVFVQEGAKVVITCRTKSAGIKMADELGAKEGKTVFIWADLTESEAIQNLINKSVEAFGKIDILVNNAGYHISKNAEDTSEDEWEFIQSTNL